MSEFLVAAGTAFWLGILTLISPCPLATNIAAVSFVAQRVGRPRAVLLCGVLYTFGRVLTYVALGVLIVAGALSVPWVSHVLEKYVNKFIGPVLVLTGMVLVGLIELPAFGPGVGEKAQRRAEAWGVWGAVLLGVVFALAFCPLSAVLFFGGLIPLSLEHGSCVALPSLYGVGTGLPVLALAVLIAVGARSVGAAFHRITQFEKWARRITGAAFVLLGIYYSLTNIFGLFS